MSNQYFGGGREIIILRSNAMFIADDEHLFIRIHREEFYGVCERNLCDTVLLGKT